MCITRIFMHDTQKVRKITKNISHTQEKKEKFAYLKKILYLCRRFMEEKKRNKVRPVYLRWAYMVISVVAAALLLSHPVFSFQEDKGIIYVRSFSMDAKTFYVVQTKLDSGMEEVTETMSVAGLHYCAWAMLVTCAACILCFFSRKWRMILCILAAFLAGAYYILMIYYAIQMTDNYYTTLYPNLFALLPAVVLQLMLLARRDIAHRIMTENENEEKEE